MNPSRESPREIWEHFPEATSKIRSIADAVEMVEGAKAAGKTVVTLNGSFDVFHLGHLRIIREAKMRGDLLIIGLNSDASFKTYKDTRGPLVPEAHRALILAALTYVDIVVLFDEPDPIEFLKQIRPDVHCNGSEYGQDCMEADTVKAQGGTIFCIPELTDGDRKLSTSDLMSRIAERNAVPKTKAILLDRDGIINEDFGYVHKIEDFRFREGAVDLLRYFQKEGYGLVVITNQSGVARGYYAEEDVEKLHHYMLAELERFGVRIQAIYFCPHHPEGKVAGYAISCDCRKPHSALFQKARKEHHIDEVASWAIGDKLRDCEAAKRVGFRTILVGSANEGPEAAQSPWVDFHVETLAGVKEIISK